jgi:hypothetical protein
MGYCQQAREQDGQSRHGHPAGVGEMRCKQDQGE